MEELDAAAAAAEERERKPNGSETKQSNGSKRFNFAADNAALLKGKAVPAIEFLVAELIPHRMASLLGGDSGSGKSILMQTLATCVALLGGHPFLGRQTMGGIAVYINAEDPVEVMHLRQERILKALGRSWDELGERLILHSAADDDLWLFGEDHRGKARPTALAGELEEALSTLDGLTFVGIDSAALVFDAEEISRRPVAAFMKYLNRLARRIGSAVLLSAHTSRSSRGTTTTMVSGSTGWVAQSRAGLLVEVKESDDGEITIKLSLIKPNHARRGISIDLVWTDDGVLMAKADGGMVGHIQNQVDETRIAALVEKRWDEGRPLSASANAKTRYLPTIMAARPNGERIKAGRAEKLMMAMIQRDVLVDVPTGRKPGLALPAQVEKP
jgi:hypothetical protein